MLLLDKGAAASLPSTCKAVGPALARRFPRLKKVNGPMGEPSTEKAGDAAGHQDGKLGSCHSQSDYLRIIQGSGNSFAAGKEKHRTSSPSHPYRTGVCPSRTLSCALFSGQTTVRQIGTGDVDGQTELKT